MKEALDDLRRWGTRWSLAAKGIERGTSGYRSRSGIHLVAFGSGCYCAGCGPRVAVVRIWQRLLRRLLLHVDNVRHINSLNGHHRLRHPRIDFFVRIVEYRLSGSVVATAAFNQNDEKEAGDTTLSSSMRSPVGFPP